MRFKNNTIHKEIDQAIALAEKMLQTGSELDAAIYHKNDWHYDNIKNGDEVCRKLFTIQRKPLSIYTFKSKIPWSKSYGYFDGKSVFINLRKLPYMTTVELAAMLSHEFSHYCGFTHGNNFKTQEKVNYSIPYFISENFAQWL